MGNVEIFKSEENFRRFLENSVMQYIKLKFGNKKNLISFIHNRLGIDVPKGATYAKISQILTENSKDFYKDVLGISSPYEAAHLYLFYRILIEIFWETCWVKNFSPFYTFLFNEKIKITKKSEHRKYAAKIVAEFNQSVLEQKWLEYSTEYIPLILYGRPCHVIHHEHLTIGPLGFVFSISHREKDILESPEPPLAILISTSRSGVDIVDWDRTDAFKLFSTILKELKREISRVTATYPVYGNYLKDVDFEFPYDEWKSELHDFVKLFKNCLKKEKIPMEFYHLVQLTAMFFKDEDIIDILNRMVADGVLVINSEAEIGYFKVTKDGIIKRPRSWLARPAFELASDIASLGSSAPERFREVLTQILENGAIKYLEEMFDTDFETFKQICARRSLHKLALLDKHSLPKERTIRLVLETYGIQVPSTLTLDLRKDIISFIKEVEKFESEYEKLSDRELTRKLIAHLRDGRTILERILKEQVFVLISLILHYDEALSKSVEGIFILDEPLPPIGYDVEQSVERIRKMYKGFLEKLMKEFSVSEDLKNKVEKYVKKKIVLFTLGDWFCLLKLSMRYVDEKHPGDLWKTTLSSFYRKLVSSISEIEKYLLRESALKWLNVASHERALREIHENVENRKNALDATLKLRSAILSGLQGLPDVVLITEKVTEAKTGLEYYEAECASDKRTLRIYGLRNLKPQFLYYLIPQFESGERRNIVVYPVLITNLTDVVF